jgi:hypothetical protein
MMANQQPPEDLLEERPADAGLQVTLILMVPVLMAFWFAPLLAAWDDLPAGKALFFSFIACLRNWRPFLVYGLGVAFISVHSARHRCSASCRRFSRPAPHGGGGDVPAAAVRLRADAVRQLLRELPRRLREQRAMSAAVSGAAGPLGGARRHLRPGACRPPAPGRGGARGARPGRSALDARRRAAAPPGAARRGRRIASRWCGWRWPATPPSSVDDAEAGRRPSYTVTTLERLRAAVGAHPLVLLMGADAFLGLESWHRWRELFELAHIAVATRPGFALESGGPAGGTGGGLRGAPGRVAAGAARGAGRPAGALYHDPAGHFRLAAARAAGGGAVRALFASRSGAGVY